MASLTNAGIRSRRLALASGAALIAACVQLATPTPARACGGTFCDPGPQGMPVDQSGENILFVQTGDEVEAHIQIQYDPLQDPASFAWVIPLTSLPSFSVGSQPLIDNLLAASVPFYGINDSFEDCGGSSESDSGDGGGFVGKFDAGASEPDPEVVFQDVVGAFEVVVLEGQSAPELMQWLEDNGYEQDDEAEPIFQTYLDEGYLFAAFKLQTGAGIDAIHPVTLTFSNSEPCVPLRLTRIAAVEDMDVRTFFLGNGRAVPTNYKHVLVNPLKVDWFNFGANYKEVISEAVDAFMAEGRAFVTEYAGPSSVVSTFGVWSDTWNASAFEQLAVTEVINTLEAQGLAECFGADCVFTHPLIEPLLVQYLPVPDGIDPADFYACLECFELLIDLEAWGDGTEFAAALDERIVVPGMHGKDLLDTWPYLTRLYTTISPGEMTEDPMFHQNADLPEVPSQRIAERLTLCDGDRVVTLPDGREVFVPAGEGWPEFPGEMPWSELVQTVPPLGPAQDLVNNTPIIDQLLKDWNDAHNWPPDPNGTTGDTGGDTTGDGTSAGPTAGTGDSDATSEGSGGDSSSGGAGSGCGCSSGSGSPVGGFGFALGLLAFGTWTRRRR